MPNIFYPFWLFFLIFWALSRFLPLSASPRSAHKCPHNILWFLFLPHNRPFSEDSPSIRHFFPFPAADPPLFLPSRKFIENPSVLALLCFAYGQNHAIIELNHSDCTHLRCCCLFFCSCGANHDISIFQARGGCPYEKENF